MINLNILNIKANNDFTIDIDISNGIHYKFDIKPYFKYPAFKKMQELSYFKKVKFKGERLYWDDMHDFPLHCMPIHKELLK